MVSKTEKCQTPNFHREVLQTNIFEIMKSDEFSQYASKDIINYIREMNRCYQRQRYDFNKSNIRERAREKCEASGLWLFATERVLNRAYLSKVINGNKK